MRDDMDALLNQVFLSGRLNVGKAKKNRDEAEKVLDEYARITDKMSESVREKIERLSSDIKKDDIPQISQQARQSMRELEERLCADGLIEKDKKKLSDIDEIFSRIKNDVSREILGQEDFVESLSIALKRPFVTGFKPNMPRARILISGKKGTGRRSGLRSFAAKLAGEKLIDKEICTTVDLSKYSDTSMEKLFIQDLFAAINEKTQVVVFEGFDGACRSVLLMVQSLFMEGEVNLRARYIVSEGYLKDIGTALVPNAVSQLRADGKYLVLISQESQKKVADTFGMPFLNVMEDKCTTVDFSEERLEDIADRLIKELCGRIRERLELIIEFKAEAVAVLAKKYTPDEGINAMSSYLDELYRAIGEKKLRKEIRGYEGKLIDRQGELAVVFNDIVFAPSRNTKMQEEILEEIKREMDSIVGLTEIKEYIYSLESNLKVQQMRKERGMKAGFPSMHMIFTGNPGTGKTTVARMISRYLKAIGILSSGQLVEVTRSDLVGRYVGHTAPMTGKAIESALGGVLFVDEAYALYRGNDDSFGMEAIDTLVKAMEDNREDLVVILAGYSHEMKIFLEANSGLKSRFPNIIEFPDYTAGELLEITETITQSKGYILSEECYDPLLRYYKEIQDSQDASVMGNGRLARNKVEQAVLSCSRRAVNEGENADLETLIPEDFDLK